MWNAAHAQNLMRMTKGEGMLATNFSIFNEQLPLKLDCCY